ncbi:MAG: hypothetical protein RL094_683 [Candidatus Parcubacteria bacterium]|jgi:hypothetical protein
MKMTSKRKRVISTVIGGALVITLAQPGMAFADTRDKSQKNISNEFCQQTTSLRTSLLTKFSDKELHKQASSTSIIKKLSDKRSQIDTTRAQSRQKEDVKRTSHFSGLEAKATTDAQKQAVATFKTSVQTAINARRVATDTAIKNYRTGVDALIAQNGTTSLQIKQRLASSTVALVDKVKARCAQGADSKDVRLEFKSGLAEIKNSFNSNVKDLSAVKTQIEALEKIKKAAFAKADADFKIAFDTARTVLKSALGQ